LVLFLFVNPFADASLENFCNYGLRLPALGLEPLVRLVAAKMPWKSGALFRVGGCLLTSTEKEAWSEDRPRLTLALVVNLTSRDS
jgi:hypothetical protein